jgi:hypothetical protein
MLPDVRSESHWLIGPQLPASEALSIGPLPAAAPDVVSPIILPADHLAQDPALLDGTWLPGQGAMTREWHEIADDLQFDLASALSSLSSNENEGGTVYLKEVDPVWEGETAYVDIMYNGRFTDGFTVYFETRDGTAQAYYDYHDVFNVGVSLADGGESQEGDTLIARYPVHTIQDNEYEGDEIFQFKLLSVVNNSPKNPEAPEGCQLEPPGSVEITILDDDPNLIIHDGQHGNAVPEAFENGGPEQIGYGAFTVANLNDTDGDEIPDYADEKYKSLFAMAPEDDEDLMELRLFEPRNRNGDLARLYVDSAAGAGINTIKLWTHPTKGELGELIEFVPGTNYVEWNLATQSLPEVVWVEATMFSVAPRDIQLSLTVGAGRDTVNATAVWAAHIGTYNATADLLDLIRSEEPRGPLWDVNDSVLTAISNAYFGGFGRQAAGGTGLRPISKERGVANAIVFRFLLYPLGIQNEKYDNGALVVQWDATRQDEQTNWYKTTESALWQRQVVANMPNYDEAANDDGANDEDDSDQPTETGYFFSMDGPGLTTNTYSHSELIMKKNAREFLRAGIGREPDGSGRQGSRASSKVNWHARHHLYRLPDGTVERLGTGVNDVGLGFVELADP